MYNLLEYSHNCSATSGSLFVIGLQMANQFSIKWKILGETPERPSQSWSTGGTGKLAQPPVPPLNIEVTISPKCHCNFLRYLDLPKDCVLIEHNNVTGVNFMITKTKNYVPNVTFSINIKIKYLANLKHGVKRTICWNKYRSEITTQSKNNNLDYLIDPIFRNFDRLLVQLFKAGENDLIRN